MTGNAAFNDAKWGAEVARILHKLAGRLEAYSQDDAAQGGSIALHDANGNRVGAAKLEG